MYIYVQAVQGYAGSFIANTATMVFQHRDFLMVSCQCWTLSKTRQAYYNSYIISLSKTIHFRQNQPFYLNAQFQSALKTKTNIAKLNVLFRQRLGWLNRSIDLLNSDNTHRLIAA